MFLSSSDCRRGHCMSARVMPLTSGACSADSAFHPWWEKVCSVSELARIAEAMFAVLRGMEMERDE
eukprot:2160296-Rhodomonas_salina.1